MDFVEWCDLVLVSLIKASRTDPTRRMVGVDADDLALLMFEGLMAGDTGIRHSPQSRALSKALVSLEEVGLVDGGRHSYRWKPTSLGIRMATDRTELWEFICNRELEPEQDDLLRTVNRLSLQEDIGCVQTNRVDNHSLLPTLDWAEDLETLLPIALELADLGLIRRNQTAGGYLSVQANYAGAVWEYRRAFTVEARFIDQLVTEWETTSVEHKRELYTNTADQKAELIKDIIGLANTQASGRRWLIVGFDDKTRDYYGPPSPKIDQNHLEQLLSLYVEPLIRVNYRVADYRKGPVGLLEVVRDPKQVPYKVAKLIGDKKRIQQGQVFVRHGSQTEEPTRAELQALQAEMERARTGS